MGKKSQALRQDVVCPSSWTDDKYVPLTPANRTIWEGKGQLRASLLPRMVPWSHISAGGFYIRSRNSPLTPYTNPLQVTPPRPHSGTTAETQSLRACV